MRYANHIARVRTEIMIPENAAEEALILRYFQQTWCKGFLNTRYSYEVSLNNFVDGFLTAELFIFPLNDMLNVDELCREFGTKPAPVATGRACLCVDKKRSALRPYFELPSIVNVHGLTIEIHTIFELVLDAGAWE